jgi:hypothetical protein
VERETETHAPSSMPRPYEEYRNTHFSSDKTASFHACAQSPALYPQSSKTLAFTVTSARSQATGAFCVSICTFVPVKQYFCTSQAVSGHTRVAMPRILLLLQQSGPEDVLPAPHTCMRQHTSAYVSIRQHTSAYVSIRQHTSAYVSIRGHTWAYVPPIMESWTEATHQR